MQTSANTLTHKAVVVISQLI